MTPADHAIRITPPSQPLDREVTRQLHDALAACPDLAFAHLVDVQVAGVHEQPNLSLFVWLLPEGVGSLRGALNLVSETVARAIPRDRFVDVLILNSVPELLEAVEREGCLFVERDAEERRRAHEAAEQETADSIGGTDSKGWWPY